MILPEKNVYPELFYQVEEAKNFLRSNRLVKIQSYLSSKGYDLLGVPDQRKPKFFVDLGCGTGLTQNLLFFKKNFTFGLDLVFDMIKIFSSKKKGGIDSLLMDLSNFIFPFKIEKIDFFISISAFQWIKLPNFFKKENKLINVFEKKEKKNCRTIIQFYPYDSEHLKDIYKSFQRILFNKFLIIENPKNKKKRKFFLIFGE
mmetsp:Transcript_6320/g.12799  ORF Transcript_6320/g.12799 Transcript_6320/m.12799 type:complete len:201 (+) Transcript_6320:70-672(+)